MVDLVTVLPVWIELGMSSTGQSSDSGTRAILRPVRVLRVLRVLRAYRILNFLKTEFSKQAFLVSLAAGSLILCTSGMMQAFELCNSLDDILVNGSVPEDYELTCKDPGYPDPCCQNLPFYTLLYFSVVTFTTVGYGDFSPKAMFSRWFMMVLILLFFVLAPISLSNLGQLYSRQDKYSGAMFKRKRRQSHVVLCGEVSADSLRYFLREMFHVSSREGGRIHISTVVVLCSRKPDSATEAVLCHPQYETRVRWIEGSAMLDFDLHRANVEQCSACFVMVGADLGSDEALMESDDLVNLVTMSLCHWNAKVPIYSQALTSANSRRLLVAGAHAVACIEELRLNILARSTVVPGLTALVSNLLSCISDQERKRLLKDGGLANSANGSSGSSSGSGSRRGSRGSGGGQPTSWVTEYLSGCCHEIVRVRIGFNFAGHRFKEVARILQAECGCILFAMLDDASDFVHGEAEARVVRLFPADRVLLLHDHCYVLAKNPFIVEEIADVTPKRVRMHMKKLAKRQAKARLSEASISIALASPQTPGATDGSYKGFSDTESEEGSISRTSSADGLPRPFSPFGHHHSPLSPPPIAETRPTGPHPHITDLWDAMHTVSELTHHMTVDNTLEDTPMDRTTSNRSDQSGSGRPGTGTGTGTGMRTTPRTPLSAQPGRSPMRVQSFKRATGSYPTHSLARRRRQPSLEGEQARPATPRFDSGRKVRVGGAAAGGGGGGGGGTEEERRKRKEKERKEKAKARAREVQREQSMGIAFETFVDDEQENSIEVDDHVLLVTGRSGLPYELLDFLAPLRAKHLSIGDANQLRSVVILSSQRPSRRHFETCAMFPDVHFIRGSPLDEFTLSRASAFSAHTIIILASRRPPGSYRDPHMADSDAISTLKFISDACDERIARGEQLNVLSNRKPFIITEMMQTSNLKYLTWMLKEQKRVKKRRESFRESNGGGGGRGRGGGGAAGKGGELVLEMGEVRNGGAAGLARERNGPRPVQSRKATMSGRLSFWKSEEKAQSNSNSRSQLDLSTESKVEMLTTADSSLDYIFRPNFASGRVYLANLSDRLVSKMFWQPQTMSVLKTLVTGSIYTFDDDEADEADGEPGDGSNKGDDGGKSAEAGVSVLSMMPLPLTLAGETFTNVFNYLIDDSPSRVCIGIYRCGVMTDSPLPYVYPNPQKEPNGDEVLLERGDLLYVVGPECNAEQASAYSPTVEGAGLLSFPGPSVSTSLNIDTAQV
eukprot:g707.t1